MDRERSLRATGEWLLGRLRLREQRLRVTPTRIVLEGRRQSAELVLVNEGPKTALFRIQFVQMRMEENGDLVENVDPKADEAFADKLVRFSPRQVELEPQASQTVRLRLSKPADLAPGEYRSHLVFRSVPGPEPASVSPEPSPSTQPAAGSMKVDLRPIFGVAIPVIVRQGETSARVSMEELRLESSGADEGQTLLLSLRRQGNRSVYGNVSVRHVTTDGRERPVGLVKGVAVYTPNLVRALAISLHPADGASLTSGRLHVLYSEPGDGPVLAEAFLPLH